MRGVVETFTKALESRLVFLKPSTRVSIGFPAYLIRSPVGFEVRESINRPLVDSLERPPGGKISYWARLVCATEQGMVFRSRQEPWEFQGLKP